MNPLRYQFKENGTVYLVWRKAVPNMWGEWWYAREGYHERFGAFESRNSAVWNMEEAATRNGDR